MPEPRIDERPAQPYMAIRREVTDGVPAAVDTAFPALFRWMGEQGIEPAGPPFIRFLEIDQDGAPLELEVAAPVAEGVRGGDDVHAEALPAGPYLTAIHVGPYRHETERDLGDARDDLLAWAEREGLTLSHPTERGASLPCSVEHFRVGPDSTDDWTTWETEFAILVVDGLQD